MICPAILWFSSQPPSTERPLSSCGLFSGSLRSLWRGLLFCGHDYEVPTQLALLRKDIGNADLGGVRVEQIGLRGRVAHPPVEGGLRIAAEARVQGKELFEDRRARKAGLLGAALRRGAIQAHVA